MKFLVVIPARGGSKGLPGKNIKKLHGKPLIHYTIEAAQEVFDNSAIIVSTDSEEIKIVAEATGVTIPFLRPREISCDTATSQEVLIHALEYYENNHGLPDYVVLLQPTSPLRLGSHIRNAMELIQLDMDMVVSVKETDSNPYYVLFEEDSDGYLQKTKDANFTRRQDCPKVWELNGSIYIIDVKSLTSRPISKFEKLIKFPMDKISSIDIDDQLDFDLAELILQGNEKFNS